MKQLRVLGLTLLLLFSSVVFAFADIAPGSWVPVMLGVFGLPVAIIIVIMAVAADALNKKNDKDNDKKE